MSISSNERGPVAATYDELQALALLRQARERTLPPATTTTTLRAILQAAEVALWNLVDLTVRGAADLQRGEVGRAAVKWGWALGFHQVLSGLGWSWRALALPIDPVAAITRIGVSESPALGAYVAALATVDLGSMDLSKAIRSFSLDDPGYRLLHLIRLSSHESRQWEQSLSNLPVPLADESYESFVSPALLRAAVFERELSGDTFFVQFRGLHQVNEILVEEMNQRLEAAISAAGTLHPKAAFDQLRTVNLLLVAALAALRPMSEHLATSDYHEIRENLGLTSGAHSVAIHYRLFGDLYGRLAAAIVGRGGTASTDDENGDGWAWQMVAAAALELRAGIDCWRHLHLHLPRNNLGSDETRSLIGSPDALVAVQKLRDAARSTDPLAGLADLRGEPAPLPGGPLSHHLDAPASNDNLILTATGQVTRQRFTDVQHRAGFFARDAKFRPPTT